MNDDYLWDRTGEPDPEIQQLEEVLGTLRYQPQPLAIPAQLHRGPQRGRAGSPAEPRGPRAGSPRGVQDLGWGAIPAGVEESGQKQSHFSHFAIAAAIAVMLLGGGWWMLLTSRRAADSARARPRPTATAADPASVASAKAASKSDQAIRSTEDDKRAQPRRRRVTQTMVASNVQHPNGAAPLGTPHSRGRPQIVKRYEAITRERTEAEAAKEQLFLALRVASAKLSLAQKRTQGTYPANMIRNQHKVG